MAKIPLTSSFKIYAAVPYQESYTTMYYVYCSNTPIYFLMPYVYSAHWIIQYFFNLSAFDCLLHLYHFVSLKLKRSLLLVSLINPPYVSIIVYLSSKDIYSCYIILFILHMYCIDYNIMILSLVFFSSKNLKEIFYHSFSNTYVKDNFKFYLLLVLSTHHFLCAERSCGKSKVNITLKLKLGLKIITIIQ